MSLKPLSLIKRKKGWGLRKTWAAVLIIIIIIILIRSGFFQVFAVYNTSVDIRKQNWSCPIPLGEEELEREPDQHT